jgi:cytochrome c biogenesis protein CcdA
MTEILYSLALLLPFLLLGVLLAVLLPRRKRGVDYIEAERIRRWERHEQ